MTLLLTMLLACGEKEEEQADTSTPEEVVEETEETESEGTGSEETSEEEG